jgi:hypothetical protein
LTLTGPFVGYEMLAAIQRQFDEGTWSYALLCDMRAQTISADWPAIGQIADRIKDLGAAERGPVALVTTDPATRGVAKMYATAVYAPTQFAAFRTIEEAERWLDEQALR